MPRFCLSNNKGDLFAVAAFPTVTMTFANLLFVNGHCDAWTPSAWWA